MKTVLKVAAFGTLLVAGTAVATAEATNPAVKARMELMQTIRQNVGVLGGMANGQVAFDAEAAATARANLAAAAESIAVSFEPDEADPASAAKPEIWQNWADFATRADALVQAVAALDTASLDGIRAGMGGVGGACQSCHGAYRVQR